MLRRVRERVLPSITRQEPIQAWIVDDTSYPKKGKHSVGVTRQYCGERGKQDNCQVAVSLSVATHQASLPIAYRLYLPKEWAEDAARRSKAGVPDDVAFQTKPEIALQQIREMLVAGVPPAVVLADPAYGNDGKFRRGITELGLPYVVGVFSSMLVWRAGEVPPASRSRGGGKTPRPIQVKALAMELAPDAWQTIAWREGSNTTLTSRFARVRVRPAHAAAEKRGETTAEEWLLIEWPHGEAEPDHYWLATQPADIPFEQLVDQAKLRWRIERDYQDLKQEVGLGHYEGRGWRGFHHHASLCIAAYGFFVSEKETIPPSGPARTWCRTRSAVPSGYRPRGAAVTVSAPHAELDQHAPHPSRTHPAPSLATMSLLRANTPETL